MHFELTEALIDDILFSMEDQEGEFLLDTVEGVVVGGMDGLDEFEEEYEADDNGSDSRYISLPEWDSASGFRLMERFAAGLRNPLVRNELSSALGRGKGVFRAFKDTLSRYPEAEKRWFAYKEIEMKREILRWYNGLREEWGLEKIGMEPEETGDLVLEDFRFHPYRQEHLFQIEELHRRCLEEFNKNLAETGIGSSVKILVKEAQFFRNLSGSLLSGTSLSSLNTAEAPLCLVAETGDGEFAGYISGIVRDSVLCVQNLEVKAEYRGLGIGEALLVRFIDSVDHNEVSEALLDLPSWAEGFSRVLLRESFRPYTVRYWLKLRDRAD